MIKYVYQSKKEAKELGKMNISPYLQLNGNAKDAIEFYSKVFNAEVVGVSTFGDMPDDPNFDLPEEAKKLISHATLKVGEFTIMLSDTLPGRPSQEGNQVTVYLEFNNVDKANSIFESLQVGGQVEKPIMETYFSQAYGVIKDKFGVTFQIYTDVDCILK